LVTLLKLNPETKIRESDFADFQMTNIPTNDLLENRKIYLQYVYKKKRWGHIKIAKGAYYPAIAIIGGYTALDLNVIVLRKKWI
jgi:hypothetical protein